MITMEQVLVLLENATTKGYIGENISQLEHALQAAYLARADNQPPHVVVAALLHDIGHLVKTESHMKDIDGKDIGTYSHEYVGAQYLKHVGFRENVTDLVYNHVDAKRYLARDCNYNLSDASLSTLAVQGGPMSDDEAFTYESHPNFKYRIAIRMYDDQAKLENFECPDLSTYKEIISDVLNVN